MARDGWGVGGSAIDSRFTDGRVKVRLWTRGDLNAHTKKMPIGGPNIFNTTLLPTSVVLDEDILFVSVNIINKCPILTSSRKYYYVDLLCVNVFIKNIIGIRLFLFNYVLWI